MNVHEKNIFDISKRVKIECPRYFRGRGRQMGYNLFSGRNPETICWFDIWKDLFTSSSDLLNTGDNLAIANTGLGVSLIRRPWSLEYHKHSFK